jgi:hypothetical protein
MGHLYHGELLNNQRVVEITHHLGYLFFEAIPTLDADTNDERR